MIDKFNCECSVFGVCGYRYAAVSAQNSAIQLIHRGEEAFGMASFDGDLHLKKILGTALNMNEAMLKELPGEIAIGHGRYSTCGASDLINAQPHFVPNPPFVFCSNGDIVPACHQRLRERLEKYQMAFYSHNDGELLAKYIVFYLQQKKDLLTVLKRLMTEAIGSYSALMIYDGKMIAFRDPLGIRPLVMGRRGQAWVVASETCALDIVLVRHEIGEILPGEVVIFEPGKMPQRHRLVIKNQFKQCIFELIYFARPDSQVFGMSVSRFRRNLGHQLAQRHSVEADFVIPVPDSGTSAAVGYGEESRIPIGFGLARNHYVGRTFIKPEQHRRNLSVRQKLNPDTDMVKGKIVVVVDDSIVRGTTSRKIVGMLRKGGRANEVHLRISSPPTRFSCFYGIDTPTRKELIAAESSLEEIKEFVGSDSLGYLEVEDLRKSVEGQGKNPDDFCYACFDGEYPTRLT